MEFLKEYPEYDSRYKRIRDLVHSINADFVKMKKLYQKYNRPLPTETKLEYDVIKNNLVTDISYDPMEEFQNNLDIPFLQPTLDWMEQSRK